MKSITLLLFVSLLLGIAVKAQTAEEIVDNYIAAIGGTENWKKVNSIHMNGNLSVQGTDVDIEMMVLHGKGMRQNISVQGMTGYQIITPTEGWNFMPFQGQQQPEPIAEDVLKESADQYDVQGPLVDYKAKGHMLELLGKEKVGDVEAHKVKVTHKTGKVETMFFDPATHYIVRTITMQKVNGQESELITDLSNYQKLPEGIVVPMTLGLPFGEMTITKMEVNKPIDENVFKKVD